MKRSTKKRKTIKNKLDKLWKTAVKEKHAWRCEKCGKSKEESQIHAHHFFGRRNHSVRWDIDNGFCLCAGCHTMCCDSAHESPSDFVEWARETRGEDWYSLLRLRAHEIWDKNLEVWETALQEILADF